MTASNEQTTPKTKPNAYRRFMRYNFPKTMKHRRLVMTLTILTLLFMITSLIIGSIGLSYLITTANNAPELDARDFRAVQSSTIYDAKGNVIAEIGLQIRENITYADLPRSVIDAFVSIEDSRFFEHNGFDIPRFTKAVFENLKSMSFSQGGSTFTMQLVKGTYFETEEATAARTGLAGVNRKIQEIKVALETEKVLSKKEIITFYLNKINYGVPKNRRGIQTAAEFYFGKDISEIGLLESAFLAGVINAPNAFSPLNSLELAEKRTHVVLDLMNHHGYITEAETALAKSVPLENLIVAELNTNQTNVSYQAYVDAVVREVIRLTGKDPVLVPMLIYTALDHDTQQTIENIQNGLDDGVVWPNEVIQSAIVTLDNETGEIIALGGGRFYEGERLFNRATEMYRQPGSAAKLILPYPLAFENLGWSTKHTLEDKPIRYAGVEDVIIKNFDSVYRGNVTLDYAIAVSLNIPAIETMGAVAQEMGSRNIIAYLNAIGFNHVNQFDLGYGIGGSTFVASPLQMAGSYRMILSEGNYITPHTVRRIEFKDGSTPLIPNYGSKPILSKEATYITAMMMEQSVSGPYRNFMQILKRNFQVYAKTGTSDWGETGIPFGIPRGAAKDKWMIAGTTQHTTAVWVGYDKAIEGQISHITSSVNNMNLPGRINNIILNSLYSDEPNPKNIARPANVSNITHLKNVFPYLAPSSYANANMFATGLIKKQYANINVAYAPIAIQNVFSLNNGGTISGQMIGYEPNNGYIYYTVVNYPSRGELIFDGSTGSFTYTHWGDKQNDYFTFNINNGSMTSNTARVNLAIKNPD